MQNTLSLNQPLVIKSLSLEVNLKAFMIISFVVGFILLGFYIFQSSELVKANYLVNQYEKKLAVIFQENSGFKINFSKLNSLNNIETFAQGLNFEKANDTRYIQIMGSQVVVR